MTDAAVKPEIKLDQGNGDVALADVEEFEEDTDLQFPQPGIISWLARIPNDLWAAWHEVYKNAPDDAKIEVGKMRVYMPEEGQEHEDYLKNRRVEIMLQEGMQQTRALPQKYNLKISTAGYNNSLVFSEKDLPGHASRSFGRNRYLASNNKPEGINKTSRYSKKTGYASAIPKQTTLAPPIQHEAVVSAQIDPEDFFQGISGAMHVPASHLTKFALRTDGRNLPPARNNAAFSSFTTTSRPLKGKKKPKEKAVRMDQQQLYDAIYRCFGQYKYWRLGAFRKELRQPETYIKTTLETVANLVRSGDFAGCWMLKPEYAKMMKIDQSKVKDESANIDSAADTDGGTGDELDDDDEPGDLEDVKMAGSAL